MEVTDTSPLPFGIPTKGNPSTKEGIFTSTLSPLPFGITAKGTKLGVVRLDSVVITSPLPFGITAKGTRFVFANWRCDKLVATAFRHHGQGDKKGSI